MRLPGRPSLLAFLRPGRARHELALVADAVVAAVVRPLCELAAHVASPLNIRRCDALHTHILSTRVFALANKSGDLRDEERDNRRRQANVKRVWSIGSGSVHQHAIRGQLDARHSALVEAATRFTERFQTAAMTREDERLWHRLNDAVLHVEAQIAALEGTHEHD
jgi:hypothetical protein